MSRRTGRRLLTDCRCRPHSPRDSDRTLLTCLEMDQLNAESRTHLGARHAGERGPVLASVVIPWLGRFGDRTGGRSDEESDMRWLALLPRCTPAPFLPGGAPCAGGRGPRRG